LPWRWISTAMSGPGATTPTAALARASSAAAS